MIVVNEVSGIFFEYRKERRLNLFLLIRFGCSLNDIVFVNIELMISSDMNMCVILVVNMYNVFRIICCFICECK